MTNWFWPPSLASPRLPRRSEGAGAASPPVRRFRGPGGGVWTPTSGPPTPPWPPSRTRRFSANSRTTSSGKLYREFYSRPDKGEKEEVNVNVIADAIGHIPRDRDGQDIVNRDAPPDLVEVINKSS